MYDYNCPDCNEAKLQSDKNARKINEIIGQVNQIVDNDIATTEYLLKKADEIVGEKAEEKLDNISTTLNNKADKDEVFSMANMGQDIKEAMVGGSVPVTGVYSVDTVNLVKNSVTKNKTDFINTKVVNLINLAKIKSEIVNINYNTGGKADFICDDTSLISNVDNEADNEDVWLFFFIPLKLEIGKIYSCKVRQNNLNKEMTIGLSYTTNPDDGNTHKANLNGDIFTMTFTCNSVTNYIRIHGVKGCVDLKDIIVYEGTDNVIWSLDKEVHVTDVDDGIITYDKLASDIKDLFYKLDDILHLNGCEYLDGINAENYSNIGDSFKVSFIEGSSYFVFKGQQFIKDHKYIITYNVVGDTDYSIGLRNSAVGYPSWQEQILTTNNQTAGAYISGQVYYNCLYDGCLGFNNSSSKTTNYTCTIRIFDVTNFPEKEINKIDFSSLKTENIITKNTLTINNSSSNNLSEKKLVFYGDSISQSGYFQNMIKNYFGCNVVTNAIGGTTIAYEGGSSFSADERISQLPSDADFVLIMGGTNDWKRALIGTLDFSTTSIDRTTIKGGLFYTIKGIQVQCPEAIIIVCTAIGGRGSSGTSTHLYPLVDQNGQSTLDIRNATIEVANSLNIDVCDTWSCGINGLNRNKYISDTVHPNTEGNKLIGNYIINFLKKYN